VSAPSAPALARGEAHVWLARTGAGAKSALAACEDLLDPREQARKARFRPADKRREFAIAHALVRVALSRYADVPPRAWRFVENAHGRPEIAGPAGVPPLRFNLSHADGLAACAIALENDIGVDVESCSRAVDLRVASRFFARDEVRALEALPAARRARRFLELWTLKEAYIKARGLGLALPLRSFAFDLAPGRPPAVRFLDELGDDPARWRFTVRTLPSGHLLALAGSGIELKSVIGDCDW